MEDGETEVVTQLSGSEAGELPGCVLYVAEGVPKDRGRSLALRQGTVIVGFSELCDLQLHDPKVSRTHAELAVTRDGVTVKDLNSTNGTVYLGNRIGQATLKLGARLRIGKTVLALLPLPQGQGVDPLDATQYDDLHAVSEPMRKVFSVLRRLEQTDAPVLIQGETGTGKELVARALHNQGLRKGKPFVVVDCGSIPANLVDSELFGHVKGAFTGASADRTGMFERADGGTLFLDEIGELPIDLQPRLLRALETGQIRRVGQNTHRQVNVRVIAATHRDLQAAFETGGFREDLYYRLAVVQIAIPPLRDRPEDVVALARHLAKKIGGKDQELPDSVLNLMSGHDWPGNVRELRNTVHRLMTLGGEFEEHPVAAEKGGGPAVDPSTPYKEAREKLLNHFESAYVRAILERNDGNISRASRSAGIARRYFKELMRKHGLYDEEI